MNEQTYGQERDTTRTKTGKKCRAMLDDSSIAKLQKWAESSNLKIAFVELKHCHDRKRYRHNMAWQLVDSLGLSGRVAGREAKPGEIHRTVLDRLYRYLHDIGAGLPPGTSYKRKNGRASHFTDGPSGTKQELFNFKATKRKPVEEPVDVESIDSAVKKSLGNPNFNGEVFSPTPVTSSRRAENPNAAHTLDALDARPTQDRILGIVKDIRRRQEEVAEKVDSLGEKVNALIAFLGLVGSAACAIPLKLMQCDGTPAS